MTPPPSNAQLISRNLFSLAVMAAVAAIIGLKMQDYEAQNSAASPSIPSAIASIQ